jgi:hypothetical protein
MDRTSFYSFENLMDPAAIVNQRNKNFFIFESMIYEYSQWCILFIYLVNVNKKSPIKAPNAKTSGKKPEQIQSQLTNKQNPISKTKIGISSGLNLINNF